MFMWQVQFEPYHFPVLVIHQTEGIQVFLQLNINTGDSVNDGLLVF